MIEEEIRNLTTAINALTAAVLQALPATTSGTPTSINIGASTQADKPPGRKRNAQTPGEAAATATIGTDKDPAKYDYTKDVEPLFREVVAECGRADMTSILSRFGVAKASALPQSAFPEAVRIARETLDKKRAEATAAAAEAETDPLA